ncbi:MAG: hypothetical protein J0H55_06570 [Chitinophagaceae bacterium]|nr:hypothetical protein [Chitinophagaceae bacterium]
MKKLISFLLIIIFVITAVAVEAQCSICTKTAMQLGDKPAQGLNTGILYLMAIPYLAVGIVGFRWWKSWKDDSETKNQNS